MAPSAKEPAPPLVASVVLNWNGLLDTIAAVHSLLQQTHPRVEVWVVDNASANGEADALAREFGERIRLLRNTANLGFSGGNNVAMTQALAEGRAHYIALLNNDAIAEPDWLARLVAAAEAEPATGVLASHMVFFADPSRTENTGIVLLSTGEAIPRDRHRPRTEAPAAGPLLGACAGAALYRASALQQVGLFRDDYFANFEDVELSLRLVTTGHGCRFVPGAVVRHKLNASIQKVRDDAFRIRSVRNMTDAYWVNVPRTVALMNLPWHLLSWLFVPVVAVLGGQWDLARILVRGRLRALAGWRAILQQRARLAPLRVGNPLRFWWLQGSFLQPYWRYFQDVVLRRKRRYME